MSQIFESGEAVTAPDHTTTAHASEPTDDLLPLLPKGDPLFVGIPTRAVVIEELTPALGDGALVVRRDGAVGVVLVREHELFETYCFCGGRRTFGQTALAEVKSWDDATVSAYRLEPELVDVCPSLLRGDPLYNDLRLAWTDWNQLLADLGSRDGTFIVELRTTAGRGVTCISNGKQIATFTEGHPELGSATLLDPLAQTRSGSVWVRCEPAISAAEAELATAAPAPSELAEPILAVAPAVAPIPAPSPVSSSGAAAPPDAAAPTATSSTSALSALSGMLSGETGAKVGTNKSQETDTDDHEREAEGIAVNPFAKASPAPAPAKPAAPQENPFAAVFTAAPSAPMDTTQAPLAKPSDASGSPLQTLLPEFKLIARNRLQRSAARVEAMLDEAAEKNKQLDGVLEEIRGLVIRGVMQSTLDDVVDEMRLLAATHAA